MPRMVAVFFLTGISGYLMVSLIRFFGLRRAGGMDHFEESVRALPMVRSGIFRYSPNGMYVFGFAVFWLLTVGFASTASIAIAAFSHLYIWVHYFATEKPDMHYLYQCTEASEQTGKPA